MGEFYGDWDKFTREVSTFSDRLERNMARATRRNAEYAVGEMKKQILSQRGGVKLSKLKPATRRRKTKLGKTKALIMSGQLVRAFEYRMRGIMKAIVGIKRYAKGFDVPGFHEERFHFVRDALERVKEKCLERWEKAFERTVQGN
ncbi:MAG TPA: hypothetical protein VMW93_08840 [bacterium]|nr:hypothetical protein [bacterium]